MDYPIILVLDQDSLDWAEDLIRTTFPKEAVGEVENSEAPLRVLKYAAALARSLSAHISQVPRTEVRGFRRQIFL